MAEKHGIERLGFLTLTFRDHVTDPKEAQRRFRSLRDHVIGPRYGDWLRVFERQKNGRIHYHLVIDVGTDIRTGFDFSAVSDHDYSSASPHLRREWSFWRATAKKFGFGRTELLPVKSSSQAIARYVGKYISKHMTVREQRDKGVRLVECSRGARMATSKYSFVSEGSASWRRKMALFAQVVTELLGVEVCSLDDLSAVLGPRWAYAHREFILALPDDPDATTAAENPPVTCAQRVPQGDFPATATAIDTQARSSTNPRDEKPLRVPRSSGGACGRAHIDPVKGAHGQSASSLRILPKPAQTQSAEINHKNACIDISIRIE